MCSLFLFKGLLGCAGGLIIHLILGSVYQWGIINVYITSYFALSGSTSDITVTGIVAPLMMFCIGLTMKLGNILSTKIGLPVLTAITTPIMAALVFASSFVTNFAGFVILYGVLFGLCGGMCFTSILIENNKYFVDKQPYVNGFILIGTGAGPALFGPFCYKYLNFQQLSPVDGLYIIPQLQQIACRVPSCIRYLSLIYFVMGILGTLLLIPVYLHNKQSSGSINSDLAPNSTIIDLKPIQKELSGIQKNNKKQQQNGSEAINNVTYSENIKKQNIASLKTQQHPILQLKECQSLSQAFCHRIAYFLTLVLFFIVIGNIYINCSYKTYAKNKITDDNFLTLIGAVSAISNGLSRFPFNLLFRKIGIKFMVSLLAIVNIIIFCTIQLSLDDQNIYCFLVAVANGMLGATMAMAPTQAIQTFGPGVGSDIYGFYWISISLASFTAYGLSIFADLNILFYLFSGMSGLSGIFVWFINWNVDWSSQRGKQDNQVHPVPIFHNI